MPSAHYNSLENSLQEFNDDDDFYDEDEESTASLVSGGHNNNNNSFNQAGAEAHQLKQNPHLLPKGYYALKVKGASPAITMTARLSRQSRLFFLLLGVVFVFVIIYSLWTGEMRLGSGGDDADLEYGIQSASGASSVANESLLICGESFMDQRSYIHDKPRACYTQQPVIYFVTPTHPRREQIPELIRLAHTLMHVPRMHWLVANDMEECNTNLDELLNGFGIPYTHLASPMPRRFRNHKPAPRGVANRRAALKWLQTHNITSGVLYFGDDDNTYDLRLFSEIRETQRVSMFPVALIADYSLSGPVVRNGKVVAFIDSWVADRRWPVDMAGFAVNIAYMSQYPRVNMPYKPGYEEDQFLRSIGLRLDYIEPRGKNCTEILVWHTQTKSKPASAVRLSSTYLDNRSNLGALFRNLKTMGVAHAADNDGLQAFISVNGKIRPPSYFLST